MDAPIGYTATFELHPGALPKFRALAEKAVADVQANEPAATDYRWYVDPTRRICRIQQQYEGSEGLIAHLQGNAVKNILPELLKLSDMGSVEVIGNPNAEARRLLDGFDATYMDSLAGFTRLQAETAVHSIVR